MADASERFAGRVQFVIANTVFSAHSLSDQIAVSRAEHGLKTRTFPALGDDVSDVTLTESPKLTENRDVTKVS